MNAVARYLDRHPMVAIALLLALFGVVGTLDRHDEEVLAAYQAGLMYGQRITAGHDVTPAVAARCARPYVAHADPSRTALRGCDAT